MTYLLPHVKCQPSTPLCRGKETVCFRTQCAVSMSPPAPAARQSAKFDIEKLRLSYVQSSSTVLPGYGPLTYINPFGNPSEAKFDTTTVSETLIENDDDIIAAAAVEAVALARAAAKLAKDVSLMTGCIQSSVPESKPVLSDGQTRDVKACQLSGIQPFDSIPFPNNEPDELEPTPEELQRLEAELAESVVVRSTRQVERKTKRGLAAEKAVSSSVTIKVGSNGRKKRVSVKEVDFTDPLRHFRGTTNTSKLLTAAEELQMSAGIQDLLKLEKIYDELQKKCGGEPSDMQWAAAAGVDQTTLRSRIHYGTNCKARMIKSNIRLVISIAKNYQGAGMNLQDLVQEGCRGLARGVEKFDASKGFKFSTYAHWWIKQAVRKSLSDQSRTIRLPFHMVEATYRVKEARKQLISDNGRQPDNEEIAEATGLSMKRLTAVLMTPKTPRSFDQKIGDMNLKPSEVTADPEAETSEDMLNKQFMRQDLEKVLDSSLGTRERQVIRWRFGLEDGRMKTLQEIGELLSISRERVRQVESSAFKKLRNKKKTQHLEQYLVSS